MCVQLVQRNFNNNVCDLYFECQGEKFRLIDWKNIPITCTHCSGSVREENKFHIYTHLFVILNRYWQLHENLFKHFYGGVFSEFSCSCKQELHRRVNEISICLL